MKAHVDRAVDFVLALLILAMTAVIFISVFFRYVLNAPLSWTDEVARLMTVWMCFLGAYMAMRENKHIGFDVIFKRLPGGLRLGVEMFNLLLIAAFLIVVVWQGFVFSSAFLDITMPYTGISFGWFAYSVFIVTGVLMLVQVAIRIHGRLSGRA